jgi:hypothetical protein
MPTTIDSAGITFNDATSLTSAVIPANAVGATQIANGSVTAAKLGTNEQKQIAKAWVNFNGTTSGTWDGGASTVTRIAGSTTATVTTTNAHGLTTGNIVYVLTGVVAGSYTVTVLTSNTFTITTVATTALNAVAITFQGSTIRSSYNVSSITKNGTGDYTVNFTAALADANYSVLLTGDSQGTNPTNGGVICALSRNSRQSTASVRFEVSDFSTFRDTLQVNVAIFGN